jgi:hypothetical protein
MNLTGERYGRLTVLRKCRDGKRWRCRCECGKRTRVLREHLRSGHTRSCGCLKRELVKKSSLTHGHTRDRKRTAEYMAWAAMLARCSNPRGPKYAYYGGRGIRVCRKWKRSFATFFRDVGSKPSSKHSLDRFPNKNGNYEPGNVRWATQKEQCRNTRSNRIVMFRGRRITLAELADLSIVSYHTLKYRIRVGWDVERAVSTSAQGSQ